MNSHFKGGRIVAREMTEEEKFWQEKEKQASVSFGNKETKRAKREEKEYELLLDNQVDFVKADLLQGLMEKQLKLAKKNERKRRKRE